MTRQPWIAVLLAEGLGLAAVVLIPSATLAWPVLGAGAVVFALVDLSGRGLFLALPCLTWPLFVGRPWPGRAMVGTGLFLAHLACSFSLLPALMLRWDRPRFGGMNDLAIQRMEPQTWTLVDYMTGQMDPQGGARMELLERLGIAAAVALVLVPLLSPRGLRVPTWLTLVASLLVVAPIGWPSWWVATLVVMTPIVALQQTGRWNRSATSPPPARSRVIVTAAFACVLAYAIPRGAWTWRTLSPHTVVAVGDHLDARLRTLDGRDVIVGAPGSPVTILITWATWCTGCHDQLAFARDLQARLGASRLRFLALNIDRHRQDEVRKMAFESVPPPGIVVVDGDEPTKVAEDAVPTTYLLDSTGDVRSIVTGGGPSEERRRLEDLATRLVAEADRAAP